jgi:hypothetical protein
MLNYKGSDRHRNAVMHVVRERPYESSIHYDRGGG